MIKSSYALTLHNGVAINEFGEFNGKYVNSSHIILGVAGQVAAGVTKITAEYTSGSRSMVLANRIDAIHMRKISDAMQGQSESATAPSAIQIPHGYLPMDQNGSLKITVEATAVANATLGIAHSQHNSRGGVGIFKFVQTTSKNFSLPYCSMLFVDSSGLNANADFIEVTAGGRTWNPTGYSCWLAATNLLSIETPDADFGLVWAKSANGNIPQTINVSTVMSSPTFFALLEYPQLQLVSRQDAFNIGMF